MTGGARGCARSSRRSRTHPRLPHRDRRITARPFTGSDRSPNRSRWLRHRCCSRPRLSAVLPRRRGGDGAAATALCGEEGGAGRRQLLLLRAMGLALLLSARLQHGGQLRRRPADRRRPPSAAAARSSRRRGDAPSRAARRLQVSRFLIVLGEPAGALAGPCGTSCRSSRSSCRSASRSSPSTASPTSPTSIAAMSRCAGSRLDMALYMSFFPQLVAGPIVRAAYFLPQLARPIRRADPDRRGACC